MIPLSEDQAVTILKMAERGSYVHAYLEQALKARGWLYIGDDWRSPAYVEALPICAHCHEPFERGEEDCYAAEAEADGWRHREVGT